MSEEIKVWLNDILSAVKNIDIHLQGKRDFFLFQKNLTVRRAVERELSIIGEAMNRILKVEPTFQISFSRIIVDLRNKVIHAYDALDNEIIWKIIIKDVPVLQSEVEKLLNG